MPEEGIRDPWTWLRRLNARPLSLGEPRTLCFDPSLSFDDRSGRNVGDMSRDLILLTMRRCWLEPRVRHL